VELYDVSADGYHTPLTRQQISELFHAGRLGRHHRCKPAGKGQWQTIDELFPLLKYDSTGFLAADHVQEPPPDRTTLVLASSLVVIALGCFVLFLWTQRSQESSDGARRAQIPGKPAIVHATPTQRDDWSYSATSAGRSLERQNAQLQQERLEREQSQLEQIKRAEQRGAEFARQERERERAAGTDVIVPLDQFAVVPDIGGSSVTVKVHDNDVTSFDVWVNGERRREVPKNKGISHSGTDETLLYNNGRGSLFYVWEISGRLNHCLLRVRNN